MYVGTETASAVWAVVLIACVVAFAAAALGEWVCYVGVGLALVGYVVWWVKA